jgi:hypothetical protein
MHGNEVPGCRNGDLMLTRHSSYQEACQRADECECDTTSYNTSYDHDCHAQVWPHTASTAVDTRRLSSNFTCNSASSHSHSGQSAQLSARRGISIAGRHFSTTTWTIIWPRVDSLTRSWMLWLDYASTYGEYEQSWLVV